MLEGVGRNIDSAFAAAVQEFTITGSVCVKLFSDWGSSLFFVVITC